MNKLERGIKVSYDLHHSIGSAEQLLMDPESKRIFFRNNNPLPVGSIMQRPDLKTKTIKAIVEKGKDGFYKGWVAETFSSAMKTNKGFIDKNDLLNYKSTFRDPIGTNYRGYKVFTQALLQEVGLLYNCTKYLQFFNLEKNMAQFSTNLPFISELYAELHNNRSHHVGDPVYYNVPLNELISIRRAKMLAENINFKAATLSKSIQSFEIEESKDTTHYSIVDADGNAVSNTYTLGYSFVQELLFRYWHFDEQSDEKLCISVWKKR